MGPEEAIDLEAPVAPEAVDGAIPEHEWDAQQDRQNAPTPPTRPSLQRTTPGTPNPAAQAPRTVAPQAPPQKMAAPMHWALEDRQMFERQTPDVQQFLLKRSQGMEAAHTRRSQELAEQARRLEPWRQVAEQWGEQIRASGLPPHVALSNLLTVESRLRNAPNHEKVAIMQQLVREYGIRPPDESGEVQANPQVSALQQQVQQLQHNAMLQEQARQQQAYQAIESQVIAFRNARDENGNPRHPYFVDVMEDMQRLAQADLAAGVQPNIASLYDRAIWANQRVREHMQTAQREAAGMQALRKTMEARRAGGSVYGAGPTARGGVPGKSVRDIVGHLYDSTMT